MATLKIQTTAYAALEKGLSNEEVLNAVLQRHPTARTTLNCISYYRSKMNKDIDVTQRIPQKAAVEPTGLVTPIQLQDRLVKAIEKLAKLEQEIYALESQVITANAAAA